MGVGGEGRFWARWEEIRVGVALEGDPRMRCWGRLRILIGPGQILDS